jgi:hypothetical protein
MARRFVWMVCLLALAYTAAAQKGDRFESYHDISYKNSFFTGGSLGFQFGSVIMIDVSPQAGYYPLEYIAVGAGFTYQYISNRLYRPSLDVNVYGGRLFSRFYLPVFSSIFAHAEYEYMAYRTNVFSLYGDMEWINLNNFLAGVGYRQIICGRSSINLMVLWNFNESEYALSTNPVIRIGFDIGLRNLGERNQTGITHLQSRCHSR